MKLPKLLFGSMFMLSVLFFASCNKKGEFDSHPPAVNKEDFKLSTSQSGKDTLYVTNKEDFKLHAVELVNKADRKLLCRVNLNDVKNTKLEADGVTYAEVKYTGGEASIIKINNWGTIEKTTIARHKKAYAMAYIGKRPSDIQLSLFVVGVNGGTVVTVK